MSILQNICHQMAAVAYKLAAVCLLCSISVFSLYAQAGARDFHISFRVNQYVLDTTYRDNAKNLRELEQFLRQDVMAGNVVFIYAYASPEGKEQQNISLAQKRAQTMKALLLTRFPDAIEQVEIAWAGENWTGLRQSIEQDSRLSVAERNALLSILDDETLSGPDKKKRLQGRQSYRYLLSNIYPALRATGFTAESFPEILVEEAFIPDAESEEFATLDTSLPQVAPFRPAPKLEYTTERYPILAVSTNTLLDLAITPNVAVEVPIGSSWSASLDYTFPWWLNRTNDMAWQILKWDLGARYWLRGHRRQTPMDIFKGHFLGLDLGAGYYDIEPKHTGYQGEFQTVGVEYGYAWQLGKNRRWRLDAYVAAGWMGTHYRFYKGNASDTKLIYQYDGRFTWLGPTKLGVSIKYIFSKERRVVK